MKIQRRSLKKYIDQWLGDNDVEFSRTAVYSFHAADAVKWQNKNIFLLGDAAHQMPPFMGQGMNSGCRDAENLLWKINGVLKGLYSENIRYLPIGKKATCCSNNKRSNKNGWNHKC